MKRRELIKGAAPAWPRLEDDEHWMAYRVILQAVALAALVATFFVGT